MCPSSLDKQRGNEQPDNTSFTHSSHHGFGNAGIYPVAGINAIRLVGDEGGAASSGFLGVFELAVATATAPKAVQLRNPRVSGAQFRFEFDSQSGVNYVPQYSTSLASPNWQSLGSIAGDGTRKEISDPASSAPRSTASWHSSGINYSSRPTHASAISPSGGSAPADSIGWRAL
jgi:hypothetical protein